MCIFNIFYFAITVINIYCNVSSRMERQFYDTTYLQLMPRQEYVDIDIHHPYAFFNKHRDDFTFHGMTHSLAMCHMKHIQNRNVTAVDNKCRTYCSLRFLRLFIVANFQRMVNEFTWQQWGKPWNVTARFRVSPVDIGTRYNLNTIIELHR
jgi:hypothetical protein